MLIISRQLPPRCRFRRLAMRWDITPVFFALIFITDFRHSPLPCRFRDITYHFIEIIIIIFDCLRFLSLAFSFRLWLHASAASRFHAITPMLTYRFHYAFILFHAVFTMPLFITIFSHLFDYCFHYLPFLRFDWYFASRCRRLLHWRQPLFRRRLPAFTCTASFRHYLIRAPLIRHCDIAMMLIFATPCWLIAQLSLRTAISYQRHRLLTCIAAAFIIDWCRLAIIDTILRWYFPCHFDAIFMPQIVISFRCLSPLFRRHYVTLIWWYLHYFHFRYNCADIDADISLSLIFSLLILYIFDAFIFIHFH